MTITPITSSTTSRTLFNPVIAAPIKAAAKSTRTAPPTPAAASSSTSTPSAPAPARTEQSHASRGGGVSASSSAAQQMQETSFSTTIAGKQYSGIVSESNGEYVASDPSLSGATASGSSAIAAENNLTIRIDELV